MWYVHCLETVLHACMGIPHQNSSSLFHLILMAFTVRKMGTYQQKNKTKIISCSKLVDNNNLCYSQTTRSVPISSSKLIWNFPNYFCNFEKPLCKSPEESCKSPYGICNVPKLIKCF